MEDKKMKGKLLQFPKLVTEPQQVTTSPLTNQLLRPIEALRFELQNRNRKEVKQCR
jgi:hypothetical protein